jgi:hypothetical protein
MNNLELGILPKTDLCIICLEDIEKEDLFDKNILYYENRYYVFSCKCNMKCHNDCIHYWISKKMACPICIRPISKYFSPQRFFYRKLCDVLQFIRLIFSVFCFGCLFCWASLHS